MEAFQNENAALPYASVCHRHDFFHQLLQQSACWRTLADFSHRGSRQRARAADGSDEFGCR